MKQELTKEELDREFYGAPPKLVVTFYMQETTQTLASAKAGKRITKLTPYIHLFCRSEEVEFRRPVTPQDKKKFRAEWLEFEESQNELRHSEVPDCEGLKPEAITGILKAQAG